MKKNPFRIARRISLGVLAVLVAAMIIVMVVGYISTANNDYTSFPPYAAAVFALIYFTPPGLIVLFLAILFALLENRRDRENREAEGSENTNAESRSDKF